MLLDIPLEPETQIYADYENDQQIVVFFTPSVKNFDLLYQKNFLVSKIDKEMDGDKIVALHVGLTTKTKFLLSRQSEKFARLTLVADEVQRQNLLTNFISSLDFKKDNNSLRVTASSSFFFNVTPEKSPDFKLVFENVRFQQKILKTYDITHLDLGVGSVSAENDGHGNAYLLFSGLKNPNLSLIREGDRTIFLLQESDPFEVEKNAFLEKAATPQPPLPAPTPAPTIQSPKLQEQKIEPAQDSDSDMLRMDTLFPGMKELYMGEKISLDLQDADVEHVLRLIAEISGYNLILADEVSGKISLKLTNIPWDQALDLVLLQRGLGMVLKGNIMRIASREKLDSERQQLQKVMEDAAKSKESIQSIAPLRTEYMQINYNTALEFEGKIKPMLSKRGTLSADARTNILIVTDTEEHISRVKSYVQKLDRPERQVMIEARLVYATDDFQRSLGIKWGTQYGDPANAANPGKSWSGGISLTGLNALETVNGVTLGGSIGRLFGNNLLELDASLALGEAKSQVKTISSPRILTLNNSKAEIQQGTKLATSTESQSGGTTTQYTEAVLKISVLPQITPDNKLILDLEISDDSPKSDGRDIDTKQTRTKMMVNDRETIVIGGVQKATESTNLNQVPGLGDIPGLGWLFKNKMDIKSKAELLIFIQPRIM